MLNKIGLLAAIAGVLICAVAGVLRVGGFFYVAGFESLTLFQVGIAGMLMACVIKLYADDV